MANRFEEALARASQGAAPQAPAQPEQPRNRFEAAIQRAPAAAPMQQPRQDGSILDPIAQGLTFGAADEIGGGVAALGALFTDETAGDAYARVRDRMRKEKDAYAERNPYVSMGAEIAGAIPTAMIPGGAAMRGASLASKMGRGAAVGAGAGAVYGFNSGEGGAMNRGMGAVRDGALGAGLGAALPGAGAMAGAAYRGVRNATRPNELFKSGIGTRAQKALMDALEKDNLPASELAARAKSYGPDTMPADTSEALRNKADVLVHFDRPGARENLRDPLRARAEGRRGVANEMFDDAFETAGGVGPRPNVPETQRILQGMRRVAADRAYKAAETANKGRPVNTTNVLQRIADDLETTSEALRSPDAGQLMRDLPEEKVAREFASRLVTKDSGQIVDFNRLSRVQQTISQRARTLSQSANGEERLAGRQLARYNDMLIKEMDEASDGLYSQARGQYREDSIVNDAFERGRGAFRAAEHPDELAEFRKALPEEGVAALKLGARDDARRMMSSSRGDLTAVQQLAAPGTRVRENFAAIVGPDEAERVGQRAKGELEKRKTEGIGFGSQTARRSLDPDNGEGMKIPMGADMFGTTLRGAQKLAETLMPDFNKGRARDLSKFLGSQGSERDRLIQALMQAETQRNNAVSPQTRALIDALLTQRAPAALAGTGAPADMLNITVTPKRR